MYKKLISSILVVALLNLVGCYSFESISVPEYKQVEEEEGKPDEIYVKTIDSHEYRLTDSKFHIENDTLYGKGILLLSKEELIFEERLALNEIDSIQLYYFGQKYPTLVTVSQYQKIEAESGKPDEIYLTKNDSTRYHFMKNDYYIENDTLYGKGKLSPSDREQPFEGKIALSEIESIQVETSDTFETRIFIGFITAIAVVGILVFIVLATVKVK